MKDGFINVLKPPGMTSHDVVGYVRRLLKLKKAGHAGTLDPGAAGVLPVAVGRATRLIEYLGGDKEYRAELTFGYATDSGDDLGKVIAVKRDFTLPDIETLNNVLQSFVGEQMQVPPVYSAIKISGFKAYELARQSKNVEIPARKVIISRLELLEKRDYSLLLDTECSKGTYIRSLCRDIGEKLGIPAVMSFLVRTRVGDFTLKEAHTLEELGTLGEAAVVKADDFLTSLPRFELDMSRMKAFQNGLSTDVFAGGENELVRVYADNVFLGIGRFEGKTLFPEKVYLTL